MNDGADRESKSDFRKAILITGLIVAVATIGMLVWSLFFYVQLIGDVETGERSTDFDLLVNSGILGPTLARRYAGEEFRKIGWYGCGFVTRQPSLWIGMEREKLHGFLGPPGARTDQFDRWYLWRKELLWMVGNSDNPRTWLNEHVQWNMCLRADYDSQGRLTAFTHDNWPDVPGDTVTFGSDGWQITCNHTMQTLPPPPPEWLAAEANNPHAKKPPRPAKP